MSISVDWLIVGLGNPGKKYANNRHNIGWMVAAALCEKYKKPIMPLSMIYYQSSLRIESNLVLTALPTTYMNNSGEAVAKLVKLYDISLDRTIIIVDEYNFPLGKLHLRLGGGDGGHNGIESIIYELGSDEFYRLRCGIGKNFTAGGMVDYVLSDFLQDEISLRDDMIGKATEALEYIVRFGAARAMSAINSGELWSENEEKSKSNSD